MNEIAIVNLKNKERRRLKQLIWNLKINVENNTNSNDLEQKEQKLLTQIEENKQKRMICIEENSKRRLNNKSYEKLMNDYELRGNELELELCLVEKERQNRNYYFRRLDYLYLILSFYDGITTMNITTNEGKKKVYINDAYHLFLNHILEEKKESLEIEHKIMQLYMLINNMKHENIMENYKYYLSPEEKSNTLAKILENREQILEVNHNFENIDKVDIDRIIVNDFFDVNIDNVYEHIFVEILKRKQKS